MIALLRTSPPTKENRRHGLTQFLIACKSPGITIRPIINLTGQHDFNEIFFDDVFVPDLHLIGEVDMAWKQATDELAYERSGPDRWLETFPVLQELVRRAGPEPGERLAEGIGREVAHWPRCAACRSASQACCSRENPGGRGRRRQGSRHELGAGPAEQGAPAGAADRRLHARQQRRPVRGSAAHTTLIAPKVTIQGGTREVLRGIIARGLGLR